jgi:MSHA biogenesis protein MshI
MLRSAGLFVLALAGIYVYGFWQVAGLEAEVVQLEGREAALTVQLSSIDPTLSADRRAEVDEELQRLNAQLVTQQRLIDVLRDQPLGDTNGFSGYLAALGRQHTSQLWLTDFAINGGANALELGGRSLRAELVPEYLQRLGREPAMSGQRFDRLEIERDEQSGEVKFRVSSRAAASATSGESLARR